jgi:hypothetical protein
MSVQFNHGEAIHSVGVHGVLVAQVQEEKRDNGSCQCLQSIQWGASAGRGNREGGREEEEEGGGAVEAMV